MRSIILVSFILSLACGCSDTSPKAPASDPPDTAGPEDVPAVEDGGAEAEPEESPDVPEPEADIDEPVEDVVEDTEEDLPPECTSSHRRCVSENIEEVCESGRLVERPCEQGQICEGDRCVTVACRPGEVVTCASATSLEICNETGTGGVEEPCPEGLRCQFIEGTFSCSDRICPPGLERCQGLEGTEICAEDGRSWVSGEVCEPGFQCDEGRCASLCDINAKVSSFLGCEYWSVDLDNIEGGITAAHAVIISNPNEIEATITVRDSQGNELTISQWPTTVPPRGVATWIFDPLYRDVNTNMPLLDPGAVDGTSIVEQAWQFESNIPVTANQFSPLVGANVFTNDASLLLPTNAIGTEYYAMSWKHRTRFLNLRGFVAVLAVSDEPTTVDVTPSVTVISGVNRVTNQVIGQINSGETRRFVLTRGQVLNLETFGPAGQDLTGTRIVSDLPVIAFGGHECANVDLGIDRCDHIESQLFPADTWGTTYVGTKFAPRAQEPDIWRVLAAHDQTAISTLPPIPGIDGRILNEGDFLEFQTRDPFVITGSLPISVGHYMVSANWPTIPQLCPDFTGIGDPALTLTAPVSQWRDDYIVLVPPDAYDDDYLNVIIQQGTAVTLDGEPIDPGDFVPIGDTGYSVAVLDVEDGPRTLTGSQPFGLDAYGYDCHVSYAYPGGLNLESR